MLFRSPSQTVDPALFDEDHDLDLVVMANNARTPGELEVVERLSKVRIRARRAAVKAEARPASRRSLARRALGVRA
jgi:hypothetical protein